MPAPKKPREFKVGDKIRVNLHHGKIEDAVVRSVIQDGNEIKLQVDVVGIDLTALIELWQVRAVIDAGSKGQTFLVFSNSNTCQSRFRGA